MPSDLITFDFAEWWPWFVETWDMISGMDGFNVLILVGIALFVLALLPIAAMGEQ